MSQLKKRLSGEDHVLGQIGAAVQIIEYGDFQCPFCAAAAPILDSLFSNYRNEVCLAFRHFPLSTMHPDAPMAAVASEAAAEQGKFWEMHHALFANQDELSIENILGIAEELDLNMKKFTKDLDREDLAEKVQMDFSSGVRSGVNGTPSLFINGVRYDGVPSYEALAALVEDLLGNERISF